MKLFSWLRWHQASFLSQQAIKAITDAIAIAEKNTSGEIRIFIEKKCKGLPMERVKEIFAANKMYATKDRNGVLLYLSFHSKQVAIYGDEGIHQHVENNYWDEIIQILIQYLQQGDYEKGIVITILDIGEKLQRFFPYKHDEDTNELSNEIMFA